MGELVVEGGGDVQWGDECFVLKGYGSVWRGRYFLS